MKNKSIFGIIAISGLLIFPTFAQAQDVQAGESQETRDAVTRIVAESGGNVTIDIPQNIIELLMTEQEGVKKTTTPNLRPGINKLAGFRVQVFSDGRHQSSLESRAKARGSAIAAKFPKYKGQIYTHSSAPNWYTRVGNFRTHAEADAALAELKRAFPSFAGEMRVVKSQIVIIK